LEKLVFWPEVSEAMLATFIPKISPSPLFQRGVRITQRKIPL